MIARDRIVAAARDWVGTPYHHQASLKGVGCDCLGLIRGIWREVLGPEPEALPPYTRDWGDATGSEPLLAAASRHLFAVPLVEALPGDVLAFRLQAGVAKHAGILTCGSLEGWRRRPSDTATLTQARFVHAQETTGVAEMTLSPWWRRRVCAVFRFPGVE